MNARHPSGDRKLELSPQAAAESMRDLGIRVIPVVEGDATARLETAMIHNDPFDEMLLVQAQEHGFRLLTRDRLLADHPLAYAPEPPPLN